MPHPLDIAMHDVWGLLEVLFKRVRCISSRNDCWSQSEMEVRCKLVQGRALVNQTRTKFFSPSTTQHYLHNTSQNSLSSWPSRSSCQVPGQSRRSFGTNTNTQPTHFHPKPGHLLLHRLSHRAFHNYILPFRILVDPEVRETDI